MRVRASFDETLMNLDSGITANGILEVMSDGYGFIRCENYMPGENDVYVSRLRSASLIQDRRYCQRQYTRQDTAGKVFRPSLCDLGQWVSSGRGAAEKEF